MKNFVPKITKEEFDRTSPHYCNCPDKEVIEWKMHFIYSGIPKYISGHNHKGKRLKKRAVVICRYCKKEFEIKPSTAKRYKSFSCSKTCKNKWKHDIETKIIELYLSGKTYEQISTFLKIGYNKVRKICKKENISRQGGYPKGKKFNQEHKDNISKSLYELYNTDFYKDLFSKQSKGLKRSVETCQKISDYHLGRALSEEHKEAISKGGKEYYKNGGKVPPVKKAEYISKNGETILMRSKWELEFAKHLDSINELWFYEFWTFDLGNTTYTPDFYLPRRELFIEIKGLWRRNSKQKFQQFLDEYPHEIILLIQHPPPYTNILFPPSSKQSLH